MEARFSNSSSHEVLLVMPACAAGENCAVDEEDWQAKVMEAAEFYSDDLPSLSTLGTELITWSAYW